MLIFLFFLVIIVLTYDIVLVLGIQDKDSIFDVLLSNDLHSKSSKLLSPHTNFFLVMKIFKIFFFDNFQICNTIFLIIATSAGDSRAVGWIPGLGRAHGGENGNPLQHYCLEKSVDRGASYATAHGLTKSQT